MASSIPASSAIPYGPPSCEAGQVCDFGCQCQAVPVCGDGTLSVGFEACDPTAEPSACDAGETCIDCAYCAPPCGNGVLDPGEQCDPNSGEESCASGEVCGPDCTCQPPVCGNFVVVPGEEWAVVTTA